MVSADAGRTSAVKTELNAISSLKEASMYIQSHGHDRRRGSVQLTELIEDLAILMLAFSAAAILAAIALFLIVI